MECDGDEWHGIEQYEEDMARQRMLERCGLRFYRIRGYDYYRDPVGSLEPLWRTLREMGIEPLVAAGFDKGELSQEQQQTEAVQGSVSGYQPIAASGPTDTVFAKEERLSETTSPPTTVAQQVTTKEAQLTEVRRTVPESEIYNYSPDFFFKLAHLAKEKKKFAPWERSLIFRIGVWRTRGWQISEKMERQALRIIREAIKAGFSEGKPKV